MWEFRKKGWLFLEQIYSALITGAFTLVVGFIGLFAGRRDAKSLSVRAIREMQLTNVWEPIEVLFEMNPAFETSDVIQAISTLVAQNHKLLPREILTEINRLRFLNELTQKDFNRLRVMNSSYYNWTKKALGYPYNRDKIKTFYTPNSGMKIFWIVARDVTFLSAFAISAVALVASAASYFKSGAFSFPEWMLSICAYIFAIGASWVLMRATQRK